MGDEVVMALMEAELIPICQPDNWREGSRRLGFLAWQPPEACLLDRSCFQARACQRSSLPIQE